jgi:hypothetical protein
MNRFQFLRDSWRWACATGAALCLPKVVAAAEEAPPPACDQLLEREKGEKAFVGGWLNDLLDTMHAQLDEKTRVKLIEGCGRGCFTRHQFKQDIAKAGQGDVDKLVAAYKRNFEVWREGQDLVHVRYGAVSSRCYCPVAALVPPKPGDLHCECTRTTHQSIFEAALGRPIKVEVVESLRRGGKTCHFLAHLS